MLVQAMRFAFFVLCFAVSFAAGAAPIGYEGARHLLNRTGFGASAAEVRALAPLERSEAVDRILAGARTEPTLAPPAFVSDEFTPFYRLRGMSAEERMAAQRRFVQQGFELRAWWLREMLATPSPLTERMTLFWHNHFATSQQKVRSPQLMYRQNALLRREALGNFATLLHAVAKDPAMLIYLDNAGSRRQAPNENFAREVMELFTLGEGHYTEHDIKEAARAFTGWSLDRDTGAYTYRRAWHDAGEKTVLGVSGALGGDDVLDVLLARPETAEFIAGKLWREFVSPVADAAGIRKAARAFRESHYEVKPLMRALLMSDAFWAEANRGTLIKSPVDLVVGTLRTFDIHPFDLRPAAFVCAGLGQNLFAPPNVKGWPGGEAWIDTATLLGRKQFVDRLFRGNDTMDAAEPREESMENAKASPVAARMRRSLERGMAAYAFDAGRFDSGRARDEDSSRLDALVLAIAPVNPIPADMPPGDRIRALVSDAAYQLR